MRTLPLLPLEWRRIINNRSLLVTVIGGLLFYAFLYPQPYRLQTPLQQSIVVINHDGSQLSRQLLRMVDASPLVEVVAQVATIEQAQQQLIEQKISGFLVVPKHFYRDLLLGRSPTLSYAGDASYFLVYGTIVQGLATTSGTLAAQVKVSQMLLQGVPLELASKLHSPVQLQAEAVFNANQGYLDYVVPAVFVIILHQTLLIALGLHASPKRGSSQANVLNYAPMVKVLAVRCLLFVAIYWVMSCFYFGFTFDTLGVHHWAKITDIFKLLLPFLIATVCLGQCIACLLPHRDYATAVGLLSSLPIVFSCGFIWPLDSVPPLINILSDVVPAKPMVLGMLKMNQMAASFNEVSQHFTHLWLQAAAYFSLALSLLYWQKHAANRQSEFTRQY